MQAGGSGAVDANGLYTAPTTITQPQTVTVVATSAVDASQTDTAIIYLDPGVSVGINPNGALTLQRAQSQQFTATVSGTSNTAVTWAVTPNVGAISGAGLYTAPESITSQQTVTVTATSTADPTRSASATITLMPPVSVSVNPASATLAVNQTQQFTAVVNNTGNMAVTWAISPNMGSISTSGLYTAPTSIASQQSVTAIATSVADSTKSASATITLTVPATATSTGPPTNLTATVDEIDYDAINLTWTASTTAGVTYNVYASTSPGVLTSPSSLVASGITGTTFQHKGLMDFTTYYYVVTAVSAGVESQPSNKANDSTGPFVGE